MTGVALLALFAAGCDNSYRQLAREAPYLSVGARDATGTFVNLNDAPRRIITLDPAAAELLYYFDRADRIAAVSEFCDNPPEAQKLPTLFLDADSGYSVRAFEEAKGDLVLHSKELAQPNPERFRAFAKGLGLPVFFRGHDSWQQVQEHIVSIGRFADREVEARNFVRQLTSFAEGIGRAGKARDTARVIVIQSLEPLRVVGNDHYLTGLLKHMKARNVMDFLKGDYPAATGEAIAGQRPDLVVVLTDDDSEVADVIAAKAPELSSTPAAKRPEGVISAQSSQLLRPGASLVNAVSLLGQYLYPKVAIDSVYRSAFEAGKEVPK